MTIVSRRMILASAGALLLVIVLIWLTNSSDAGYRAVSVVRTKTYKNTIAASAFETQVMHTTPGVLRVGVTLMYKTYVSNPGPGDPVTTNAMNVYIVGSGPTAEEAERVANEAATKVCTTILTNYGVTGEILQPAKARPYSFLKDKVRPAGTRLYQLFHH